MGYKTSKERREYRIRYRANLSPEKKEEIRQQEKRAKKKHRANMNPKQRRRERELHTKACAKIFANLNPERREEVREMRKQATRKFLIKRYGLTHGEFDEMLAAQNGACAICGRTDSGRKTTENLHIDHCHKTGKIRGLLCDFCNNGLARFCDNPNLLRKAAAYLESQN
jgi:hypothetical protein